MNKLLFALLIIPTIDLAQKVKKSDVKALFINTVTTIKNNDSLSFFNLWEHPDSTDKSCEGNMTYAFHKAYLFEDFKRIRKKWLPTIDKLILQDIIIEKTSKKDIDQNGHLIELVLKYQDKKSTPFGFNIYASYVDNKLVYSLGSNIPDQIVP